MDKSRLLKSVLGNEVYDSLMKSLTKLSTRSVVDIQELDASLNIAPKAILAFLLKNLRPLKQNEAADFVIPWEDGMKMSINKQGDDVYKGNFVQNGKIVHSFELVSIPQLAVHCASLSENYDKYINEEESIEETSSCNCEHSCDCSSEETSTADKLKSYIDAIDKRALEAKLASIEDKINQLFLLLAQSGNNKSDKVVMDRNDYIKEHKRLVEVLKEDKPKDIKEEEEEQEKSLEDELDKSEELVHKIKKAYGLKKAGIAPQAPKPPKAGSNVGGMQGITQGGIHSMKTKEATSRSIKETKYFLKDPNSASSKNNLPQLAKQPKTSFTTKTEKDLVCEDCGEKIYKSGDYKGCTCFKALSEPKLKKNQNGSVTYEFKKDWDPEFIKTLYRTLVKK